MSYPYQQNYPGAGGHGAGGPGYSHPPPPPPPPGYGQGQYTSPPHQQQPWGPPPPGQAQAPNWQPHPYPPYNPHNPQQTSPPPPGPSYGYGHGYPGQPSPSPTPGQFTTHGPIPSSGGGFTPPTAAQEISYPYLLTAKREMTLFTPDKSRALFTVHYPDTMSFSWTKSRTMSILESSSGKQVGGAEFHSFTTDKVDLSFKGRSYHFKKKFSSQTGMLAGKGKGSGSGEFIWDVTTGEMWLTAVEDGKEKEKGKETPPILARFVPRDGAVGGTKTLEGRLEVRMMGLSEEQFEEVFVTMVAEMERKRKDKEEQKMVSEVVA